eukprot:PhM_4_TR11986/c0_g4_i1/m.13133
MGNLCCGGDDEDDQSLSLVSKRVRRERWVLTTPAITEPIYIAEKSIIKIDASCADKQRTMELNLFNASEKEQFERALDNPLARRIVANNALSIEKWKTATPFSASAEMEPGEYYYTARSSSKVSDKNQVVTVAVTITPLSASPKAR